MGCIRIAGDFLFLNVRVVPGSSKSAIVEVKDGKLKIRIAAVPQDGKAYIGGSSGKGEQSALLIDVDDREELERLSLHFFSPAAIP